jgi:hypothetical protein
MEYKILPMEMFIGEIMKMENQTDMANMTGQMEQNMKGILNRALEKAKENG